MVEQKWYIEEEVRGRKEEIIIVNKMRMNNLQTEIRFQDSYIYEKWNFDIYRYEQKIHLVTSLRYIQSIILAVS